MPPPRLPVESGESPASRGSEPSNERQAPQNQRPPPVRFVREMLTSNPRAATAAWSAATSRRLVARRAVCEFPPPTPDSTGFIGSDLTRRARFAFVEYEDKRDADEAYYDMHNKRMGRDDILKIEVGVSLAKLSSSFPIRF